MSIKLCSRFATGKYFRDNKYINLSLYSQSKATTPADIAHIFQKLGISITSFNNHPASHKWKQKIHLSIPKQTETQLYDL